MKQNLQKICPDCFSSSMEGAVCSKCGYKRPPDQMNHLQLPQFFVLYKRYLLGRVIGSGGFGITYKAYDMLNDSLCAIKEFVPFGIAARYVDGITLQASARTHQDTFEHGKRRFLEEAEVLKRLGGIPEVVRITDYFSENNTVYFVMEFLNGVTLKRMTQTMGGRLPVRNAVYLMASVARALDRVHRKAGIFHRDISPENIMLTADGKIKIIDFGSAKYLTGKKSQNLSVVLKPGFAPPEQYSSSGRQGSYTDVYALAGTFYYIVSGIMIPEAPDRLSGAAYTPLKELNLGVAPYISDAVDQALLLNFRERIQTAGDFADAIDPDGRVSVRFSGKSGGLQRAGSDRPGIRKRAYLSGIYCGQKEQRWELTPGKTFRAGRSAKCAEIVLVNDAYISKLHFEIRYREEERSFYLRDKSTNGVYIGGRRLEKEKLYRLKDQDTFTFGKRSYVFRVNIL